MASSGRRCSVPSSVVQPLSAPSVATSGRNVSKPCVSSISSAQLTATYRFSRESRVSGESGALNLAVSHATSCSFLYLRSPRGWKAPST